MDFHNDSESEESSEMHETKAGKSKPSRKVKRNRTGKQFSEEQKLKIVNKIGKTMTKSKLAKDYNIAYSTLRKWELMFLPN